MHKILVNTHKESNINILKARDYFFDKARFVNNRLRKVCLLAPIVVSVLGMFAVPVLKTFSQEFLAQWLEEYLDVLVGCIAIAAFVIDFYFQNQVEDNLSKSNALREMYDVKVLDIVPNDFYYHYTEEQMAEYLQTAKYVKDSSKYEVWYREIFSKNNAANAICAMMDNIIYTYHVYTENMKWHLYQLLGVFVLFAFYCAAHVSGGEYFAIVNPFVLFLALFDYIKDTIDGFFVSKDLAQKNRELKETVVSKADMFLSGQHDKTLLLRCVQDVVIDNREKGLFIPKYIRDKFLKNDSMYYRDLDLVKRVFWGKDVEMPRYAKDFEICSVEDEDRLITLESIHRELVGMLEDVKACLERNQLSFLLDGGTLIGAYRKTENQGFLQWDDDIDITVKSSEVEQIKEVLKRELGDKYDIQDYYNEDSYSPRLAAFRIRQKNTRSMVCEKDSELYELYKSRGLFIDVYAFCPILSCRWVDALYRYLFIHLLNKRIRKVEADWKFGREHGEPEPDSAEQVCASKALAKFQRLKERYIKRAQWYIRHAKNEKYVAYEPFYIYDLKKAGPYILTKDIYGEEAKGMFEGKEYAIPSNSAAVLSAYYGKKWHISPFLGLEDLVVDGELVYSKTEFDASNYKHLKKVSVYGEKIG